MILFAQLSLTISSGVTSLPECPVLLLLQARVMFSDLPNGCVALVVELLYSVKDVLNFQATCTRHAQIVRGQQKKRLQLLHTDYDTRLQVG